MTKEIVIPLVWLPVGAITPLGYTKRTRIHDEKGNLIGYELTLPAQTFRVNKHIFAYGHRAIHDDLGGLIVDEYQK